jgi:Recombinase
MRRRFEVEPKQGVSALATSSDLSQLAKRIRTMRKRGMTLQAICDKFNAEGVPTPRGGSAWRPTSLRAVLDKRSAKNADVACSGTERREMDVRPLADNERTKAQNKPIS